MLPVILYRIEGQEYDFLMDLLMEEAKRAHVSVSIELHSGDFQQVVDKVQVTTGIILFIIGVSDLKETEGKDCLKLGRLAMKQNRDNYAIYITQTRKQVEDVISLCIRPSGVMSVPLDERRTSVVFKKILRDFQQMESESQNLGSESVFIKVGSIMHRLNRGDIVYVQAMSKKISLVTPTQSFEVYKNMKEISDLLGDSFIQCHRSFLINRQWIRNINMTDMMIQMNEGSQIPMSRSYKDWIYKKII